VDDFIWRPDAATVESARVTRFLRAHGMADVRELVRRSTADTEWFWRAALEDLDVRWDRAYDTLKDESRGFPWTRWFVGGRLNIAGNTVDRQRGDTPALIWEGDDGGRRVWSRDDLRREANRVANALRALGIGTGDAVGLYMPMVPEMAAAFFGCLKIGAISGTIGM